MASQLLHRRDFLIAGAGALTAITALGWANYHRTRIDGALSEPSLPMASSQVGGMPYRRLGNTDLLVSEIGFGAWGIGGKAYGDVSKQDSLQALARAEELGCNFVDTAQVYGDSEAVLGEFLSGRRDRWLVATKYSGQQPSLTTTLEQQLRTLRTDRVDLYQIHWVPRGSDAGLYDELYAIKKSGKARYIGVSASSIGSIEYALKNTDIDVVQLPFNLLEPNPFLGALGVIRASGAGIIIRSSLKEGFLAGKFIRETRFTDPDDQRSKWSRDQIMDTVDQVERFRFLEQEGSSMVLGSIAYPLSFPEVSTVILGTKNVRQAEENFGKAAGMRLSRTTLKKIWSIQDELDLAKQRAAKSLIKRLLGRRDYL